MLQAYRNLVPVPAGRHGPKSFELVESHMDMNLRSIICPADAAHPRCTEASMISLTDGSLFLAYTRFEASSRDDATAAIYAKRSTDGGTRWSEDEPLQANTGGMNVMSPSFLRRADGALLLFFLQKDSHASCRGFIRISSDDGATWSEPISVTDDDGYHVVVNDALIALRSGRIIVPVQHAQECWSDREHYRCFSRYSDDGGTTWTQSKNQVDLPKRGAMEPGIVHLRDGSLLMYMRTQLGSIYYASSSDDGESWSEPWDSGIASPESPAAMRRIGEDGVNGPILLIWNHCYVPGADHCGPRRPLSAAVSYDEGVTFVDEIELEHAPDRTHAYPSILEVDGTIYLTYYETSYQMGLGTDEIPLISLVCRRLPTGEMLR